MVIIQNNSSLSSSSGQPVPSICFIDFGFIVSVLQLYYTNSWYNKTDKSTIADTLWNPPTNNGSILNTYFICSISGSMDILLWLYMYCPNTEWKHTRSSLFGSTFISFNRTNQIYSQYLLAILVRVLSS
jgi:hypothetical protein